MKFRRIAWTLMLFTLTWPAVFNRLNTVINTPAAWQGVIGTFEVGGAWAPYYSGNLPYWEDDYYINYYLTDFFSFGLTRINGNDIAGNMQMLLGKDILLPKLNVAFGIDNIIAKEKGSTFDTLLERYANNMSLYLVLTYRMDQWEYSAGYGEGRFANFYNAYNAFTSNLFYSATYYFSKDGKNSGKVSVEYDGRDYHVGTVLPLSDQINIKFALTQLPFRSGNNLNYGDIPYQNLTIGFDFKVNLFSFYGEEYSKFSNKLKEIDDKSNIVGEKYNATIASSKKAERIVSELDMQKSKLVEELKSMILDLSKQKDQMKNEIKALREVIESEGFRNVQTLKEDIMKHYYRALQYYYDEKYFESIEELTKAKMINDKIPEIHIRLGSIYWTMGLKTEAMESWETAFALDKNNDVLNTFLKANNISFEKNDKKEDK